MSIEILPQPTQNNNKRDFKDFTEAELYILQRAEIAVRCAPFTVKLFADMATQGINLRAIAGNEGVKNQYLNSSTNLIITENALYQYLNSSTNLIITENALLWLIQVGILRREVDGQGITDSFRLTPMGHLLLDKWQNQSRFPSATIGDRLQNFWAQIQISRFL